MSSVFKKRFEVIFLVNHPKGPKMSIKQAARYTKTSETFVKKWLKRYTDTGNVDNLPGRGKTRTTTKRTDRMISKLFEAKPTLTLRQAREKLAKRGIHVSIHTIRRRLLEANIKHRSTLKKPMLTQKQIKTRLQWAKDNLERDWTNVIFTDESSFWVNNILRSVWTKKGEVVIQRTVKHPGKVHAYGCFSAQGFGNLILFTGNLTASRMVKLYRTGLLKSAEKLFGTSNRDWILQEDNDPKHRSRLCTEWKANNGINRMDWPSQSPDANPIENVWSYMKHKLQGHRIRTIRQLKVVLKKIWKSLTHEYAENLAQSCKNRCEQIIASDGDWTPY